MRSVIGVAVLTYIGVNQTHFTSNELISLAVLWALSFACCAALDYRELFRK